MHCFMDFLDKPALNMIKSSKFSIDDGTVVDLICF